MEATTVMGIIVVNHKLTALKAVWVTVIILSFSACSDLSGDPTGVYNAGIRANHSEYEIALPLCGTKDLEKVSVSMFINDGVGADAFWKSKGFKGKVVDGKALFTIGDESSWTETSVPLTNTNLLSTSGLTLGLWNGQSSENIKLKLTSVPQSPNKYLVLRNSNKQEIVTLKGLTCG